MIIITVCSSNQQTDGSIMMRTFLRMSNKIVDLIISLNNIFETSTWVNSQPVLAIFLCHELYFQRKREKERTLQAYYYWGWQMLTQYFKCSLHGQHCAAYQIYIFFGNNIVMYTAQKFALILIHCDRLLRRKHKNVECYWCTVSILFLFYKILGSMQRYHCVDTIFLPYICNSKPHQ